MGGVSNRGYQNEREFVKYLNGKRVRHLNLMFQELVFTLFGEVDENEWIKAKVNLMKKKYDIELTIKNQTKRLSLKIGMKNSVHVESIWSYQYFLKQLKVPKNIREEIRRYHYADGTLNGTGHNRMSVTEYKEINKENIQRVNEYFQNEELLKESIRRFLFLGRNSDVQVDAIIYGEVNDFLWATKEEIVKHLLDNRNYETSAIHFSTLIYQALTRKLTIGSTENKYRNYIQIKWYRIFDDLLEIMNKRYILNKNNTKN